MYIYVYTYSVFNISHDFILCIYILLPFTLDDAIRKNLNDLSWYLRKWTNRKFEMGSLIHEKKCDYTLKLAIGLVSYAISLTPIFFGRTPSPSTRWDLIEKLFYMVFIKYCEFFFKEFLIFYDFSLASTGLLPFNSIL